MSSPPLRDTIRFMMGCRRGFDPGAALQDMRQQLEEDRRRAVDTLATTLLQQQTAGELTLKNQFESVRQLNPFDSAEESLEQATESLATQQSAVEEQVAALEETEKTISASKAAYHYLEIALNKQYAALIELAAQNNKTLSREGENLCLAGEQWSRKLSKGKGNY